MQLRVRRSRIEDLPEVCRLERACFKHPYPPQLLYMFMTLYPELFLIAECEGRVVGYVCGVVRRDGFGHIVSICVDPGYRRRGIGRTLMESIERVFREVFNICRFRLEVRVSNVAAIKLYEKLGFKIARRLRSYYLDGEDAYLMIKDLCVDKSKNVGS
ncbi:MAG: ribosomal protein S18-alanine N-acetyltransferase [Crenarchaeota archaeon]|nr:ribosomal protein S18-alanine N-acetyltransferase [Thermoproteota archaeon]